MRAGLLSFAFLACCVVTTTGANAQPIGQNSPHRSQRARFELVDAAGLVSATIEIYRGGLVANEANGERVYYDRAPQYDSPDRLFVGYFNTALNRVLRFPRRGRGPMQGVDLDDPFPRFSYLSRTVRPIGGFGSSPAAYIPPSNYGVPFQGLGVGGGPYGTDPYALDPYGSGSSGAPGVIVVPTPISPLRRAPRSVLLDSHTVPRPALEPVTLKLFNGGPREVRVTVDDLQDPSQTRQYKIPSGGHQLVRIQRDAGADLVERYRTVMLDGQAVVREVVHPVEPQVLYEVVVHEWAIQSIAIDRTGKSPQAVEDVHYQGRGLGRFPLPPGDQLKGGSIDVFRAAKDAQNQGSVAPILTRPKDAASEPTGLSPLERALLEQQRASGR